ncbi:MAG: hypothetical protein EBR30_17555 [Cytophagia bacterium]|jgi:hypothetical protein|nr:hypothetical protein [Cytophagia bacterium]NBW36791.1 hypothetical protein [Cytophagia bacterium]
MKIVHIVLLIVSSLAIVAGTFMHLQYQMVEGLFVRDAGLVGLIVFVILFFKHLKSNNETTSK